MTRQRHLGGLSKRMDQIKKQEDMQPRQIHSIKTQLRKMILSYAFCLRADLTHSNVNILRRRGNAIWMVVLVEWTQKMVMTVVAMVTMGNDDGAYA
ncbi:Protein Fam83A [Manis pentadactyla]|nr:Protein Fam83A [Manis pentadactyla]